MIVQLCDYASHRGASSASGSRSRKREGSHAPSDSCASSSRGLVIRLLPSPGQALEAEDASKMGPLWAHDANVLLVNPANKSISVGWEAVKEN
jgi:hypothetical protein